MDRLAETDKMILLPAAKKTKKEVLGSQFGNKVATEDERAEYSKGLCPNLSEIIPGGLRVIFKHGESGANSMTPLM